MVVAQAEINNPVAAFFFFFLIKKVLHRFQEGVELKVKNGRHPIYSQSREQCQPSA